MKRSFIIGFVAAFFVLLLGATLLVRYTLTQRAELDKIAREQKQEDIRVTIIEGKRREEIASQLSSLGVCGYAEFLEASASLEGSLFPDTYRFFPNTPATQVVDTLTRNYERRTSSLEQVALPEGIAERSQITILASLIEREAKTNEERALISAVYLNRLRIGMKLDADPTVQYAKDSLAWSSLDAEARQKFTFWGQITRADYSSVISPYNTYRNQGLPPSAIANPGIASLQAAYTPSKHDYFYFFHRNGQLFLSKTLAEHEQKLRQF